MKKLLAVLMAMSVILSFTTGFSYTLESRLEIVEYGYMSQDNEKINTLYNETSVKGYVEYTNNTESSSFSMILSYYNAEGRLIDTKIASVTATEFEDTVYTPEIAVSGGAGSYFKLFVLNDCVNMSPVVITYPTYTPIAGCANDGETYADEIAAAINNGFLDNEADGEFHADKPVTREELAVAIDNLVSKKYISRTVEHSSYKDVSEETYNYSEINQAVFLGYMTSQNGYFYPNKLITTQDTASALNAVLNDSVEGDYLTTLYTGITLDEDDYISKGALAKMLITAYEPNKVNPAEMIKVAYNDIVSVTETSAEISFSYMASEIDRRSAEITVSGDVKIYLNGGRVRCSSSSELIHQLKTFYGYITFTNPEGFAYTVANIEDYETIVVDEVTSRFRVTSKNDTAAVIFDPEDEYCFSTLYDENGELMNWEDLSEWDIVSIKRFMDSAGVETVEGRVLTKTVSGYVEGISNEGYSTALYRIGGKQYGIDWYFDPDAIMLGDKGTFYLDIFGNITYFASDIVTNYAYIKLIGFDGTPTEPSTGVLMFTSNNEYKAFTLANSITLDGVANIDSTTLYLKEPVEVTGISESRYRTLANRHGLTHYNYDADTQTLKLAAIKPGNLIKYTIDDTGYITAIDRAAMEDTFLDPYDKFAQKNETAATLEYNAATGAFSGEMTGRLYITDKTVIMMAALDNVDGDPEWLTEDDFALFSTSLLEDEQVLEDAYAFDVDEDKNVGFILVTKEIELVTPAANMTLVKSCNPSTDATYYNIKMLRKGEEQTFTTADDCFEAPAYSTVLPRFNAYGKINDGDILAGIYAGRFEWGYIPADSLGTKYCYGDVTEISRQSLTIENGRGDYIDVTSDTNVYVYDNGLSGDKRVSIGCIEDYEYDSVEDKIYIGKDTCTIKALAREVDGDVVDVVLYVFRE